MQKTFDSASTALFTTLTAGEHFPRVLLYVSQVGAANYDLFYELGTVLVTSIDIEAATGDSAATETVEMVFGAMQIDYTPTGASALVVGWDQVANAPVNLPDVATPAPAPVPPAPATIWIIGTSGTGSHPILHYAQPTASWVTTDGLAARVAVASDGRPWVVNAAGAVFRRLAGRTSYDDGSWQYISGIAASDIGVGADGSVWVLDMATLNGGHGIWPMTSAPASGLSGVGTWRQIEGAAVAVSVGPDGQRFVVNSSGSVFSRARGGSTNSCLVLPRPGSK
ncbi:MAG: tectonin domain-containing protein [Chloroflexota bacterium]